MAKRNAKKQATRMELEASDPVCRKLNNLADEADVLILSQGADYDTESQSAREYDKRLEYLSVLIGELIEYRVILLGEDAPVEESDDAETSPPAPEGEDDAADDAETE